MDSANMQLIIPKKKNEKNSMPYKENEEILKLLSLFFLDKWTLQRMIQMKISSIKSGEHNQRTYIFKSKYLVDYLIIK